MKIIAALYFATFTLKKFWNLIAPETKSWFFPLWQRKNKTDNTYAEKIALARLRSLVQFFRHIIYKGICRLSPLDSRLFTTLHYTSFQSAPFTISRLAAALTVMIDNPFTAIADCQPSICLSRSCPATILKRWKRKPL